MGEEIVMAVMEGVASTALTVGLLIVSTVIIAMGIFALVLWSNNKKKYGQYNCHIWDGKGVSFDTAGVFVDKKTKNKRLFLRKFNVGLNPDKIPYKLAGKRKIIYLVRYGLKNFRFVDPIVNADTFTIKVGEEDVNWALNAYDRGKIAFTKDWLEKYLPFILIAFVSIIILILFIYLFKQLDTLKEFVLVARDIAVILAQARAGTVVMQ